MRDDVTLSLIGWSHTQNDPSRVTTEACFNIQSHVLSYDLTILQTYFALHAHIILTFGMQQQDVSQISEQMKESDNVPLQDVLSDIEMAYGDIINVV